MKNKPFWSVKNLTEGTEKEEIEVKVYGEIVNIPCWDGDVSANSLKREIDKYPNAKKISVRINSPGGDVFEAQAIYNILKNHPAEVEVHIDALAASAATLIASAGNKIIMYNNALFIGFLLILFNLRNCKNEILNYKYVFAKYKTALHFHSFLCRPDYCKETVFTAKKQTDI